MTNTKQNQTQTFGARTPATMSPAVAQMRVTRDLHDAEAALDEALIRQANLLSSMVTARREAGLPPFLGQDALMRLLKSQQAMVDAGGELARVHGRLSTIAVETMGGNDACPKTATLVDPDAAADSAVADAA
ncbi:hypothetical protein [Novosphingobium pokkalii]|uniref:Phasin protein n=1 Tax=Novosphingobium pokkalii TaxID=1770194 RepID=A0ABV7V4K2_9SPHN|nr:hypothetical protein [Novosphingobium pokkalii]GHC94117.1 hypothetical protein GCM10019060_21840 [Novosphingobium pokkalii]